MAPGSGRLVNAGPEPAGEVRKHVLVGAVISLAVGPGFAGTAVGFLEGGGTRHSDRVGLLTGLASAAVMVLAFVAYAAVALDGMRLGGVVTLSVLVAVASVVFGWAGTRTGRWLRYL